MYLHLTDFPKLIQHLVAGRQRIVVYNHTSACLFPGSVKDEFIQIICGQMCGLDDLCTCYGLFEHLPYLNCSSSISPISFTQFFRNSFQSSSTPSVNSVSSHASTN
ncbi:hypothetical protein Barb7_02741 [Bacteroidales bacterium Barb7]|nr:hypothetical protein Barb7_02741 [Bacteroidales bacterium Barb7]